MCLLLDIAQFALVRKSFLDADKSASGEKPLFSREPHAQKLSRQKI
jgi:hypothetical protein